MKEKIQKLATAAREAAELLKAEKTSEAITKLEEVADAMEEASKDADEAKEEVSKLATEVADIKKWADLYVSADSIKTLIEEFNALKESITKSQESNAALAVRLEVVENAAQSRQVEAPDQIAKSKAGMWSQLVPNK